VLVYIYDSLNATKRHANTNKQPITGFYFAKFIAVYRVRSLVDDY